MSYCRWSSDDFKCDIYAYESDEGYVIHVAGNHILGDIPHLPDFLTTPADEWAQAYQAQSAFLRTAKREAITLPYAGETFTEGALEDFEALLLELRELGYHIPDDVFARIAEERKEEA